MNIPIWKPYTLFLSSYNSIYAIRLVNRFMLFIQTFKKHNYGLQLSDDIEIMTDLYTYTYVSTLRSTNIFESYYKKLNADFKREWCWNKQRKF